MPAIQRCFPADRDVASLWRDRALMCVNFVWIFSTLNSHNRRVMVRAAMTISWWPVEHRRCQEFAGRIRVNIFMWTLTITIHWRSQSLQLAVLSTIVAGTCNFRWSAVIQLHERLMDVCSIGKRLHARSAHSTTIRLELEQWTQLEFKEHVKLHPCSMELACYLSQTHAVSNGRYRQAIHMHSQLVAMLGVLQLQLWAQQLFKIWIVKRILWRYRPHRRVVIFQMVVRWPQAIDFAAWDSPKRPAMRDPSSSIRIQMQMRLQTSEIVAGRSHTHKTTV